MNFFRRFRKNRYTKKKGFSVSISDTESVEGSNLDELLMVAKKMADSFNFPRFYKCNSLAGNLREWDMDSEIYECNVAPGKPLVVQTALFLNPEKMTAVLVVCIGYADCNLPILSIIDKRIVSEKHAINGESEFEEIEKRLINSTYT